MAHLHEQSEQVGTLHCSVNQVATAAKHLLLVAFCCFFLAEASRPALAVSAELSPVLLQHIPDADQKLQSADINDGIAVLDELILPLSHDRNASRFRYKLPRQDYVAVVKSLLHRLPPYSYDTKSFSPWEKLGYILQTLKLNEFAKSLARRLGEKNTKSQSWVLTMIEALQAQECVPEIIHFLKRPELNTPEMRSSERLSELMLVREQALETLITLNAQKALPFLTRQLQDGNKANRSYALKKLTALGAKGAASDIARLLEDSDPVNRHAALEALVQLGAKEQAPAILKLIKRNPTSPTGQYGIKALLLFERKEAIPLVLKIIDVPEYLDALEFLSDLSELKSKAKVLAPALIWRLKSKQPIGGVEGIAQGADSNIRIAIMGWLAHMQVKEAIPVLRSYLSSDVFQNSAVAALGIVKAREAIPELLPRLDEKFTGDSYSSAVAALALVRIGDWATVPQILDAVDKEGFPERSNILSELNAVLDSDLWQKIETTPVPGLLVQSVADTAAVFTKESGIPIILHATTSPKANTGVAEGNLLSGLYNIIDAFSDRNEPVTTEPYTFLFDRGTIHILPVEEAVKWWREKILPRQRSEKP